MVHVVQYCYSKYTRPLTSKGNAARKSCQVLYSPCFLKSYTIVGDEFDEEKHPCGFLFRTFNMLPTSSKLRLLPTKCIETRLPRMNLCTRLAMPNPRQNLTGLSGDWSRVKKRIQRPKTVSSTKQTPPTFYTPPRFTPMKNNMTLLLPWWLRLQPFRVDFWDNLACE